MARTPPRRKPTDAEDVDNMLGALGVGPNLTFEVVRKNIEGIDRLIAENNANSQLWLAAYMMLASLTREVIENTRLVKRRYIPKAPPVFDFEPYDADDAANVAYIREVLPVARRDFAEFWAQYVTQEVPETDA